MPPEFFFPQHCTGASAVRARRNTKGERKSFVSIETFVFRFLNNSESQ